MAACIVCNVHSGCEYLEHDMATARSRLVKVVEEAVPEDSVICSGCQFDLEQIEMYYCLLTALKMRYQQAAEERSKHPEGYQAPTSPNVLAETVRYSTADTQDISQSLTPETVFPVSMYSVTRGDEMIPEPPETSAPLEIEILDVRTLQEDWQQATEPLGEDSLAESFVQEDPVDNGLDLGCWSEGSADGEDESQQQPQGEHLMAIPASDGTAYDYNTQYFGYDGSDVTYQVLTDDSAAFSDALPAVHTTKTWKRKAGRPKKMKQTGGRPRKIKQDLILTVTPQLNEVVDNAVFTTPPFTHTANRGRKRGRPRKNKPEKLENSRTDLIASPITHAAPQHNESLHAVGDMPAGKRKVGRPRKYPPVQHLNHTAQVLAKRPVGRPKKKAELTVGATPAPSPAPSPAPAVGVKTAGTGGGFGGFGYVQGKKLVISIKKLDAPQASHEPSGAPIKNSHTKSRKAHRRRKNHEIKKSLDKNNSHDPDVVEDLPLSDQIKKSKCKRKRRRLHSGSRKCSHCGIKFPSDDKLIAHSLTHNDTKPFKCTTCGQGFRSRYYMVTHTSVCRVSDSDTRERFVCTVCGKALVTKSYLRLHMARHTGTSRYRCTVCQRACVSAGDFRQHMLVHSDDKPHKCTECGKAYKQIYPLRVHMRTHTGERPFKCECGLDFKEKVSLKLHMRSLSHAKRLDLQRQGVPQTKESQHESRQGDIAETQLPSTTSI